MDGLENDMHVDVRTKKEEYREEDEEEAEEDQHAPS